jgi:uncharacterized membrane protein YccC
MADTLPPDAAHTGQEDVVPQTLIAPKPSTGFTLKYRTEIALAVRVTVAAVLALILAKFFSFNLPLWAVLTALVVTQASIGRSLKATIDYLAGTLGGAIYGGAIAVLIPHAGEFALLTVLALALAPLAFLAAVRPSLAVAPVTATIVLLVPEMTHTTPIASAIDRIMEVVLGGTTGVLVSLLVLPTNAHRLIVDLIANTLDQMSRVLGALPSGLQCGLDIDQLHKIQDEVGQALVKLSGLAIEAEQERVAHLVASPKALPQLRTLLRMRHDIAMIGRTMMVPLTPDLAPRLVPALTQVSAAFAAYLLSSAEALRGKQGPPSLDEIDRARATLKAELEAIRTEGLLRQSSERIVERLYALSFAFEQLRSDCGLFGDSLGEWQKA